MWCSGWTAKPRSSGRMRSRAPRSSPPLVRPLTRLLFEAWQGAVAVWQDVLFRIPHTAAGQSTRAPVLLQNRLYLMLQRKLFQMLTLAPCWCFYAGQKAEELQRARDEAEAARQAAQQEAAEAQQRAQQLGDELTQLRSQCDGLQKVTMIEFDMLLTCPFPVLSAVSFPSD